MPQLKFTVPGIPVAKGRPKFARRGNFVATYTPAKTENFEAQLKYYFMQEAGIAWRVLDCPVSLNVTAYFHLPKSKKNRWEYNEGLFCKLTKPDIDNIIKIVCDGLNHVAWRDDSLIWDVAGMKFMSEENPHLLITMEWME